MRTDHVIVGKTDVEPTVLHLTGWRLPLVGFSPSMSPSKGPGNKTFTETTLPPISSQSYRQIQTRQVLALMFCDTARLPQTVYKVGVVLRSMHEATTRSKGEGSALFPSPSILSSLPLPLTLFHRRSPANMKPLLVIKSDPTMLIAVDRLPENTNPDTCVTGARIRWQMVLAALVLVLTLCVLAVFSRGPVLVL